jgi:hypothetical protein
MDLGLTRMPDPLTATLTDFAEALRELGIDPATVEVSLTPDDWKRA